MYSADLFRNIIEHCLEWNCPLYISFIDLKKTFGSLHRGTLWKILRSHGVSTKLVTFIELFYQQCHHRRKALRVLPLEGRSATGLHHLAHALPSLHRMDYAQHSSRTTYRNPMDPLDPTWRPGFCWPPSRVVVQPITTKGDNREAT